MSMYSCYLLYFVFLLALPLMNPNFLIISYILEIKLGLAGQYLHFSLTSCSDACKTYETPSYCSVISVVIVLVVEEFCMHC